MKIGGREPAFWVGLIVSLVAAVLSVLTGQGVISDALAGKVTDTAEALSQLVLLLLPLITGLLIRPQVTPVSQPSLPVGTPVLVAGTGDQPPPDASVQLTPAARAEAGIPPADPRVPV
jgi:hypothetical protein